LDADHPQGPLVRIEEAGLGADAQVRLVLSGVSAPDKLRGPWSSSGAAVELDGTRLRATTTVQALARAGGRALARGEAEALDAAVRGAVGAALAPPPDVELPGGSLPTGVGPLVMGVVNVTPDSFSDGGVLYPNGHPDQAVAHAEALVGQQAALVDVGGESTRPGAEPVELDEELERVLPVVQRLAGQPGVIVSIDTRKAEVARQAVAAGAQVVNDVSGGADPELLEVVAENAAGYVLMHTRGTPADMLEHATYDDVVADVYESLAAGLERCAAAGIAVERILVDPGLGFAKTAEHNLALLRALQQLRGLGRPVMVGASRKSFLGTLLGGAGPGDRLEGSLACATAAVLAGAAVVRAHDVEATVRAVRVAHAIATGTMPD
jgi:dihydropteroate synthase